jgi:predicted component of type VI protein secretion system
MKIVRQIFLRDSLMRAFLRIKTGMGFRDAAMLQADRPLIVGRATTADIAVPDDHQMSSSHATITLTDGKCLVQDNGSTNGTFLNGAQIKEGELKPGDELRCGATILQVDAPDGALSAPASVASTVPAAAGRAAAADESAGSASDLPDALQQDQGFVAETAMEIVQRFELQKDFEILPEASESTAEFIARLAEHEEENHSLNFLAFALPKRCGVWWAVQCVQSPDSAAVDDDPEILEIVTQWVKQPSEELRRKAMEAAEAVEMSTASAWAGVAAFWSHGSMAPPDAPAVPAADNMAGKAIAASVVLSTLGKTPIHAVARRKSFVQLAQQIAAGELPWQ